MDICPHCDADLQGLPIPESYRQQGLYGPPETAPTHYRRTIAVEEQGVYDGALYFRCPDCNRAWHRWTDPHMRTLAEPYLQKANALAELIANLPPRADPSLLVKRRINSSDS